MPEFTGQTIPVSIGEGSAWNNPDNSPATQGSGDINYVDGNVAIGKATPDTPLDVEGSITGGTNNANTNVNSIVTGTDNIVSASQALVAGYNNTVSGYGSLVTGGGNTSDAFVSATHGRNNTVTNGSDNLTFGLQNTVSSFRNLTGGNNNINNSVDALVIGGFNTAEATNYSGAIVGGQFNTMNNGNGLSITGGFANTNSAQSSFIIGQSNTLLDSAMFSAILAGIGITGTAPNTAYAANLLTATGGVGSFSDERVKENIEAVDYGLKEVMQLKPKKFDYKDTSFVGLDESGEQATYTSKGAKGVLGFTAQDVLGVLPEVIQHSVANVGDVDDVMAINYQEIIPVLVRAIQEQQAQIEAIKAEM